MISTISPSPTPNNVEYSRLIRMLNSIPHGIVGVFKGGGGELGNQNYRLLAEKGLLPIVARLKASCFLGQTAV